MRSNTSLQGVFLEGIASLEILTKNLDKNPELSVFVKIWFKCFILSLKIISL